MTKLHTYLFLMLTCWSIAAAAQLPTATNATDEKGRRQGDWVVYYDEDWEEIVDASNAEFYRKISYENDKPQGLVTDYYLSGTKQWEGYLLSDRPDYFDGVSKYYYKNGNIKLEGNFRGNSKEGEWKNYIYDGGFSHNTSFKNGKEQGFLLKISKAYKYLKTDSLAHANKEIEEVLMDLNKLPNKNNNNHMASYKKLIANYYLYIRSNKKFIELQSDYLKITANVYGTEYMEYCQGLSRLGGAYYQMGKYNKALDIFLECLTITKNLYGSEHLSYIQILQNVANIYNYLNDYEKGLDLHLKCLEVRKKLFGENHLDYALSLYYVGWTYFELEAYNKALDKLLECLNIRENIYAQNNYNSSLELTYEELANIYSKLGDYNKSLEMNLECLKIREKLLGKEHLDYARSLTDLAECYYYLGVYSKSLDLNQKSMNIIESLTGKNNAEYVRCLNNMANIYIYLKDYEKGLSCHKECLDIRKKLYGEKHRFYILSLSNLATTYIWTGNYDKALTLNAECVKLIEKNIGVDNEYYARGLHNIAYIHSLSGEYVKSLDLHNKSIQIRENIYGKGHPSTFSNLNSLAYNYFYLKKFNAADSVIIETYKLIENQYSSNSLGLSENEKEEIINSTLSSSALLSRLKQLTIYSLLRERDNPLLLNQLSSAWLVAKGLLFSSAQRVRERVLSSGDTSLVNLYNEWKIGKLQLGKYYEATLQELEKNGVDLQTEEERVNALEQELSRKSLSFAESQKKYTWKDVKSKLNFDEAYVELIRTDYYDFKNDRYTDAVFYAALIIDENTKEYPALVVLENGVQLEQAGYKYYASHTAGKNKQNLDEYSYRNYWSAIAERLEDKKRVYVSSDGVYNKLNLNVLYNNETGRFLGEEMDIRLVTSGRDLFKTYPKEENKELTAVLVGSPKYDLIQEQKEEQDLLVSRDLNQYWIDSLSRGWSVSALPGTAKEVSNISDLMTANKWKVTTYTDKEALEGKVKSVSTPTVLHLATHGYFFEDVAKEKESSTRMMGVDTKKATQNPLLRSGLLFAGAKNTLNGNEPKSGDNGLLTAYEASYMDLRGTELVVLSACETGRGEIKNGEGVYGLQRAMQQAGAKNIIMSMWKVDDKVTQEFMTLFYSHWLEGRPIREAFKTTQNTIKQKYPQPYYWGAFVLVEG